MDIFHELENLSFNDSHYLSDPNKNMVINKATGFVYSINSDSATLLKQFKSGSDLEESIINAADKLMITNEEALQAIVILINELKQNV